MNVANKPKLKPSLIAEVFSTGIIQACNTCGTPYLVGGAVRDMALGIDDIKDIDLEVHGTTFEDLSKAIGLATNYRAKIVGEFKVIKYEVNGLSFDISVPREEESTGEGHNQFEVSEICDPGEIFNRKAYLRRDFTINAGYIRADKLFIYGGAEFIDSGNFFRDLKNRVLRINFPGTFSDDPLRVYRGFQFAARFGLSCDPITLRTMSHMSDKLKSLPVERINAEWEKLLLSDRPSIGLELMRQCGIIKKFYPELHDLVGTPQHDLYHPEGDVWIHTMMVADCAAEIASTFDLVRQDRIALVLSAICHDLGKPSTTEEVDSRYEGLRAFTSRGHEGAGEDKTRSLLERIGVHKRMISLVEALVVNHLRPWQLYKVREKINTSATRRLINDCDSGPRPDGVNLSNIQLLCLLADADHLGRTTTDAVNDSWNNRMTATEFIASQIQKMNEPSDKVEPIIKGRHVIQMGIEPGPRVGEIVHEMFEMQLDGVFKDLQGGIDMLENYLGLINEKI